MSKVHTKTSPEIMQEVSLVKEQWIYNFRNQTDFVIPQVKSVNYGLERIRVLEPKNGTAVQMTWKIKNWLMLLKQPLRYGNLNHFLGVFVKLIYKT